VKRKSLAKRLGGLLLSVTVCVGLAGCQPAMIKTLPAADGKLQDPGIVSGQLPNGFSYLLRSTNASERRKKIDVRLIVKAGSLAEREHEQGYAHLLEHVVFRGTRRYSAAAIEALLEDAGLVWGLDVNATTHYAATVYRFSLTEREADMLPEILALLADFLDAVNFQPESIELEKRIVEAEWRFRYGHRNFVVDPVVDVALAGTRHSQRPPIGSLASVRRATADSLGRFWQRHYRPGNASLVVSGSIVPWKLEQMVRQNFARLPERLERITTDSAVESDTPLLRLETGGAGVTNIPYINPDIVLPQVSVNFISTVKSMDSIDSVRESFREGLLYRALTHLLSYRLSATPHCGTTAARTSLLETGQSINTLEVTIADEDYLTCLQSVSVALNRILRTGLRKSEYSLLKRSFRNIAMDLANTYRNAGAESMAESLMQNAVYGTPLLSAYMLESVYIEMIERMNVARFNTLLRSIPEDYGILYTATAARTGNLPTQEQMSNATAFPDPAVLKAIRPARKVLHGELKSDQLLDQLEALGAEKKASNVVGQNDYFEWKLSNGARAIFLRDEKYDYVAMSAISAGGYLLDDRVMASAARVLPRFVKAAGAGGYLRKSLQRLQSERDLFTSVFVDSASHGVNAYSVPSDLPLLIELVSAYFDEPVIVEPVSSELLRKLNSGTSSGISLEEKFWQKFYGQRKQLYKAPVLNTGHLKHVQQLLFRSPSEFTFVFVGNIDPDTLARELTRIERHAASKPDTSGGNLQAENRLVNSVVTETDAENSRLLVGLFHGCRTGPLQREVSEYYLRLLSHIVERRVRYVLRENRGLSYNIEARLLADSPGYGMRFHQVDFSVRPQDVTQARVLINSVLNAMGRFGVTERELQLAVKREDRRQRDLSHDYSVLAHELAVEARYGASLQYRTIGAPSVATINSLASCFSADNSTFIVDNEFTGNAGTPASLASE